MCVYCACVFCVFVKILFECVYIFNMCNYYFLSFWYMMSMKC